MLRRRRNMLPVAVPDNPPPGRRPSSHKLRSGPYLRWIWRTVRVIVIAMILLLPAGLVAASFPRFYYFSLFFGAAEERYCMDTAKLFLVFWASVIGASAYVLYEIVDELLGSLVN